MSAAEQQETVPAVQRKTETRRSALLRRMGELMNEMDRIRMELMTYSLDITSAELEPVIESFHENKNRLLIEVPVEGMANVLAMYDPEQHQIVEQDSSVDAITIAAMMALIERNEYESEIDLQNHSGVLSLRFRVGDEHHGHEVGEGMLLVSSLPKATNGAQWFATVEEGQLKYNDQLKAFNAETLQNKIEKLLEDEGGPTLEELNGYYLFIGNSERFSEFLKEPSLEERQIVGDSPESMVTLAKAPSDDYLAKIGPNGRIRYRSSTADLVKQIKNAGRDAKVVLNHINELALDRVDDSDFIYVMLK